MRTYTLRILSRHPIAVFRRLQRVFCILCDQVDLSSAAQIPSQRALIFIFLCVLPPLYSQQDVLLDDGTLGDHVARQLPHDELRYLFRGRTQVFRAHLDCHRAYAE